MGTTMGDSPDIRQVRAVARILLVCPDCGHENAEYAKTLRGTGTFYCAGDGCDYIFDLAPGERRGIGGSFSELCKRLYAAFYKVRRPSG
jgi:rubredoxin